MKKRIFAIFLIAAALLSFSSCGSVKEEFNRIRNRNNLRIGILLTQGENEEHITALKHAAKDAGIKEKRIKTVENAAHENVYNALCTLADDGCNLIFTVGNGTDDFVEQAATDYPEAEFFHIDSTDAETSGADNLHNAFFDETQLRYVSGVAAGYKLRELIGSEQITESEAQIGFVASYPDSKAISAYTAFYLGIKSVCESAVMKVQYTYDSENEESGTRAVRALISNGCVLVSQQSETDAAAEVCQRNGVYYIGQNVTENFRYAVCVASMKRDYTGVYAAVIEKIISGDFSERFVCADYSDSDIDAVQINEQAFADKDILNEAKNKLFETETSFADGTAEVFDTSKWTVNGEQIKTTVAEDLKEKYQNKEYINSDGYFSEYEFSVEPKFAFIIDGITQMNAVDTEEDLS